MRMGGGWGGGCINKVMVKKTNFLQVSFEILLKFELDVIIFRENSYRWEIMAHLGKLYWLTVSARTREKREWR